MNASFKFSRERALRADEGGYIIKGGIYVGVITKMVSFTRESGSGGVELSVETISGQKCDYIQIYTRNKDKLENYAKAKIDAALGILGIEELPAVKVGNNVEFPQIYKKRIAFALQREDYIKEGGTIGWKMNLLHFFYPDTMQTFREHMDGCEANTSKFPINDLRLDDSSSLGEGKKGYNPDDDDLPF